MNETHKTILHELKKFRLSKIEPILEEDEKSCTFRPEIFQQLGDLGLTGITTSEEFSGSSLGIYELALVLEELANSSASYAVTLSVSSMVQSMIQKFGSQEQKKKYLPALATGKEIGAFALSESQSGSDAASLRTQAQKVDGGYILNGNKMWITSAGLAKTYVVMARTGEKGAKGISSFIIRDKTKGFSYGKNESKMGWKISPTRELILNNVFVPDHDLLGEVGKGFSYAMQALNRGRITIGAIALGIGSRALDESLRYANERSQFNQKLIEFQGLQFMLAQMATELQASRLLVYEAAKQYDEGKEDILLASMAKLKSTDTTMSVTTDAVQILGGVGYTTEFPVERLMRDAKVLQIVEGTNQIQKVVIAKELKKQFSH